MKLMRAYKIYTLMRKIITIRKSIPNHMYSLCERNHLYHKGKLNTHLLMISFEKEKRSEIFSIKREIIKLKNFDK